MWVLTPVWGKPPLSMNDRGGWRARAAPIASVRRTANLLARAAGVPAVEHIVVRMVWTVPNRIHRDNENPIATMKPFCDGLVDAGLVPDDVPRYMTKLMPVIEYVPNKQGVRFELSERGEICQACGAGTLAAPRSAAPEPRKRRPRPITPERPIDG